MGQCTRVCPVQPDVHNEFDEMGQLRNVDCIKSFRLQHELELPETPSHKDTGATFIQNLHPPHPAQVRFLRFLKS